MDSKYLFEALNLIESGNKKLRSKKRIIDYFNTHPDAYIRVNARDGRGYESGYIDYPGAEEDGISVDPEVVWQLYQDKVLKSERNPREGEYITYYYINRPTMLDEDVSDDSCELTDSIRQQVKMAMEKMLEEYFYWKASDAELSLRGVTPLFDRMKITYCDGDMMTIDVPVQGPNGTCKVEIELDESDYGDELEAPILHYDTGFLIDLIDEDPRVWKQFRKILSWDDGE